MEADMSAWRRLRTRRLGRRSVLRTATRAGIGAVGLALVGCSDDGEDSSSVAAEPEQRTERSAAVQASSGEAQEAPASAQSGATGTVTRIEPKLAIGVDPIDWRTRFHWSKLGALPGHREQTQIWRRAADRRAEHRILESGQQQQQILSGRPPLRQPAAAAVQPAGNDRRRRLRERTPHERGRRSGDRLGVARRHDRAVPAA